MPLRSSTLVLLGVLASSLALSSTATGKSPNDTPVEVDVAEDVQAFADYFDVSAEQAHKQLALQAAAGDLNAELLSTEAQTFSGMEIDHRSGLRVTIHTTSPCRAIR